MTALGLSTRALRQRVQNGEEQLREVLRTVADSCGQCCRVKAAGEAIPYSSCRI